MSARFLSVVTVLCAAMWAQSGLRAETPLSVTYVRPLEMAGWELTCYGSKWDIGRCTAWKKVGRTFFRIGTDKHQFELSFSGKCLNEALSAKNSWDLESGYGQTEIENLINETEKLVALLPKNCRVSFNADVRNSIEYVAIYLTDFAD